jgi:hypothetical protein
MARELRVTKGLNGWEYDEINLLAERLTEALVPEGHVVVPASEVLTAEEAEHVRQELPVPDPVDFGWGGKADHHLLVLEAAHAKLNARASSSGSVSETEGGR